MSIIWIDIWDVQSGSKAKCLINRCFNVSRYITTIRDANMNLGVPQCKNCWKWGHATFSCRIQGSKCIKYNGPTNWKITMNLDSVVRQMRRQTLLDSRWRRENHVCTCSSAQTVGRTTKLTQTNIPFGGTNSIESGSKRNTPRSVKTGSSQFVLWRATNTNNDSTKPQNILTKCLQEPSHY